MGTADFGPDTRQRGATLAISSVLFIQSTNKVAEMPLAVDLLQPNVRAERRRHKLKRLVQHPNSYFMDVKCPGCYRITTLFSHANTVVVCAGCSTVLCQPSGGRAKLTDGCAFRRKT